MMTNEWLKKANEEKLNWIRSLKVGDIVEDCRYKHCAIVKIDDKYFDEVTDNFYKYPKGELVDRILFFEDGTQCSAMNCCC